MRTWNLSSLWRIPVESDEVWLKNVPPFFAHGGAVLTALQGKPVPRLIAHDGSRILMHEIPGEDLYGAPKPTLLILVSMLVDLQSESLGRQAELFGLGLPDWRAAALSEAVDSVVRRTASELSRGDRRALDNLVAGLPQRYAAIEECGIPDTLVHGDFAPGNARGDGDHLVLLDWADCGVGHPLLDQSAFMDRISPTHVPAVQRHWAQAWRKAIPECRPSTVLLKDVPPEQLVAAVRIAHQGDALLAPSITRRLIEEFTQPRQENLPVTPKRDQLSPRKREVFRLLARGLTNHEIAE